MAQEKSTLPSRWPFGFMGWDVTWLLVFLVLIVGLIPTRWWAVQGEVELPSTPSVVPTTRVVALVSSPTATSTPTPTNTPIKEPTSTPIKTSTSTPIPNTPTPSPMPVIATATPPPTFTLAPTDTPTATMPAILAEDTPIPSATSTTTIPATATSLPTAIPTPTLTPRPTTIVYVQSNGQTHELKIITPDGLDKSLQLHAAAPAWSPDGTKIAFFGEPAINQLAGFSQGNGIYIIGASQGSNHQQLVSINNVMNIAWSPDGLKLAYEFTEDNGISKIVVVDARDGKPEFGNFVGQQPAWGPNSDKLAVRYDLDLWVVNIDGHRQRKLTDDRKDDSFPAWSPDDKHLVFASPKRDNDWVNDWEIYRLDLVTEDILRLTDRPGTDTTPVFSPDGTEIYFRTDAFGSWQIKAMAIDGSNERLVLDGVGPSNDDGLARPAVH